MKHVLMLTLLLGLSFVLPSPGLAIEAGNEQSDKPKDNKPEPEKPTRDRPKENDGRDREQPRHVPQHWTGTCEYLPDGRILVHTAFLHNPEIAARQCREWLEERN